VVTAERQTLLAEAVLAALPAPVLRRAATAGLADFSAVMAAMCCAQMGATTATVVPAALA
jgi:hypothetical protein